MRVRLVLFCLLQGPVSLVARVILVPVVVTVSANAGDGRLLVQQFLSGIELAVAFVGSCTLPISEIDFSGLNVNRKFQLPDFQILNANFHAATRWSATRALPSCLRKSSPAHS